MKKKKTFGKKLGAKGEEKTIYKALILSQLEKCSTDPKLMQTQFAYAPDQPGHILFFF